MELNIEILKISIVVILLGSLFFTKNKKLKTAIALILTAYLTMIGAKLI